MNLKQSLLAIAMSSAFVAHVQAADAAKQAVVDSLANNLLVKYEVVTNDGAGAGIDCQALGSEWASCGVAKLHLTNQGASVDSKEWELYIHSIRRIQRVDNEQFTITHLTGDLYRLTPTDKFQGFAKDATVEVPLVVEYWVLFESDIMPNWYISAEGAEPKVIASMSDINDATRYEKPMPADGWKRTKDDNNILMNSETRFAANQTSALLPAAKIANQIVPTPLKQEIKAGAPVDLSSIKLDALDLPSDRAEALKAELTRLGVTLSDTGYPVSIKLGSKVKQAEGYDMTIGQQGTVIRGHDVAGAFWGAQSLLSLLGVDNKQVSPMRVEDAPRFEYRGMQTDVARHFRSAETMKKLVDQMAAMKLNVLHLGLTNDEGWRIEIPGLPELTEVGSKRCHDLSETQCLLPQLGSGPTSDNMGTGFYSKADYIELVRYAKARGVTVIPEINMPAHARAAVVSMEARYKRLLAEGKEDEALKFRLTDPQDTSNVTSVQFYDKMSFINPCQPGAANFVAKVMEEVAQMHQAAGQPLTAWHYGGDEAKNIMLGGGYQDPAVTKKEELVGWRGNTDWSKQDKPFGKSPVCQKMIADGKIKDVAELPVYFAKEVSELVKGHGFDTLQAWEDGLKYAKDASVFATANTRVNFWETLYWGGFNEAMKWAHNGYEVVLSNPDYLYFDFPNEVHPAERGYYWATRFNDTRKVFAFAPENLPQNAETSVDRDGNAFVAKGDQEPVKFKGISGQQWSETIRTDAQYEYMVYPRIFSLAERAWHKGSFELPYVKGREFSGETKHVNKAALNQEWNRFANVLGQRVLPKLDQAGVEYRLSVPGARVVGGVLEANVDLPGLPIQYSLDGKRWSAYDAAAKPQVSGKVYLRTVSFDGKRVSRVTEVNG
ncbi:beta-N-acetylhexosaminidase [Aeromonas simiae]|uniref:beta-N-acetylhexosaminidase n=1 Tax=Aeromonas simiae TaxID=218936 RepID=UPI00266DC597|nr:beta-N-acetylhexosaminidase [Aeromonas simiae]MDO2947288.1 carbohydate-binding domain-containing protein [Aeromonas simiae]MDO2950825.1 carbohydate-binding domain-containing protein [Aeromonas simiae]MDO2954756.1 carbohydate-binding domain-containing protein [Aeromonas simiae]